MAAEDSGVVGTRSGASRGQRHGNRSKPWEPPHVDTGHLRRNVDKDKPRPLVRRVGTGLGNKESVGYAWYLEFGTRFMLPRPFVRPSFWRMRRTVRRYLARPL